MKALALAALLVATPAGAMSVKDFNAQTPAQQSAYVAGFIEKMTGDLATKDPQLAGKVRDYFSRKPEGKPLSEGIERLYVELAALEDRSKAGKTDLSKTQLEAVIVWIVKQKFPPQG